MKMIHVKRQLLALFMPGFLLGILYVNLEAEQFAAGAGIFSEYFLKQYRAADILTGEYIWSFAVFSAAGICFYKIQKSGSYSVLDLDGLFCRTSVFYGSSRDGSKREHPVHCRNAPPVFMLYSSVSDRGVVCVLLPAYAVEYTEKSGFRRSAFSWYRVRTVCKSGFGRSIFENPLSRDEMF